MNTKFSLLLVILLLLGVCIGQQYASSRQRTDLGELEKVTEKIVSLRESLEHPTSDVISNAGGVAQETGHCVEIAHQRYTLAWQNLVIAYRNTKDMELRQSILNRWDEGLSAGHYSSVIPYQILALNDENYCQDFMTPKFWDLWYNSDDRATLQAFAYIFALNGDESELPVFDRKIKTMPEREPESASSFVVTTAKGWLMCWIQQGIKPKDRGHVRPMHTPSSSEPIPP